MCDVYVGVLVDGPGGGVGGVGGDPDDVDDVDVYCDDVDCDDCDDHVDVNEETVDVAKSDGHLIQRLLLQCSSVHAGRL